MKELLKTHDIYPFIQAKIIYSISWMLFFSASPIVVRLKVGRVTVNKPESAVKVLI